MVGHETNEEYTEVTEEEGKRLKDDINCNFFIQIDKKNVNNKVNMLLDQAFIQLYEKYKDYNKNKSIEEDRIDFIKKKNKLKLNKSEVKPKKKNKCEIF